MRTKLTGIGNNVDFVTQSGDRIEGRTLYVCYEDPNVMGLKTDSFFVRNDIKMPEIKVNDVIDIDFSPKGKILSISTK